MSPAENADVFWMSSSKVHGTPAFEPKCRQALSLNLSSWNSANLTQPADAVGYLRPSVVYSCSTFQCNIDIRADSRSDLAVRSSLIDQCPILTRGLFTAYNQNQNYSGPVTDVNVSNYFGPGSQMALTDSLLQKLLESTSALVRKSLC